MNMREDYLRSLYSLEGRNAIVTGWPFGRWTRGKVTCSWSPIGGCGEAAAGPARGADWLCSSLQ
jgi:hypothetical protein